jgi:hypothetical protein
MPWWRTRVRAESRSCFSNNNAKQPSTSSRSRDTTSRAWSFSFVKGRHRPGFLFGSTSQRRNCNGKRLRSLPVGKCSRSQCEASGVAQEIVPSRSTSISASRDSGVFIFRGNRMMKTVYTSLGKNNLTAQRGQSADLTLRTFKPRCGSTASRPTGALFTTLPSFITKETRSAAVMSLVGWPGMAIMSASSPFSRVPTFGRCRRGRRWGGVGAQSFERRHAEVGHEFGLLRVLRMFLPVGWTRR